MQEYIRFENHEIRYLAITNFDDWYFFEVKDFVRYFGSKSHPVYAQFQKFEANQMSGNKTSDFYNDIAKPAIDGFLESCDINVVRFNLADAVENTKMFIVTVEGDEECYCEQLQRNSKLHRRFRKVSERTYLPTLCHF